MTSFEFKQRRQGSLAVWPGTGLRAMGVAELKGGGEGSLQGTGNEHSEFAWDLL